MDNYNNLQSLKFKHKCVALQLLVSNSLWCISKSGNLALFLFKQKFNQQPSLC